MTTAVVIFLVSAVIGTVLYVFVDGALKTMEDEVSW